MHFLRRRPRNGKTNQSSTIFRYLGLLSVVLTVECSAKHNRGVLEAFTEASRVSLTARPVGGDLKAEERKKKSTCVIL
jgi:hypothetical protein